MPASASASLRSTRNAFAGHSAHAMSVKSTTIISKGKGTIAMK